MSNAMLFGRCEKFSYLKWSKVQWLLQQKPEAVDEVEENVIPTPRLIKNGCRGRLRVSQIYHSWAIDIDICYEAIVITQRHVDLVKIRKWGALLFENKSHSK